jgi:benzylsuccinate CoA-transferase BbsF subunit
MTLPDPLLGLPLSGLRVLDLGTTVAAPTAARCLADFGAQVIKIESMVHPDTLRVGTPYAGGTAGINRSGYFAAYNAGKLSFSLNLKSPRAKEVIRRLVERSDILIEAYAPGVMDAFGLTYEQLSTWNPRLIMASHCLQGQSGPYSRHRGYGQIASAMTGWYDITGYEGEPPQGPYSAYTDFIAWPFFVTAILTALEVRDVTGRGQHIDQAQVETSIHFLSPSLLDLEVNGRMLTRRGNREEYAVPNNTYRCGDNDRWVALTVLDDAQWSALCSAMGRDDLAADPRFETLAGRQRFRDEIDTEIDVWMVNQQSTAVMESLQAIGVPAGIVARASDLLSDPQLASREFFRRLPHPEIGDHAVLTQSFRMSDVSPGPWRAAPMLGEHTHSICEEILGMTDQEIADFAAAGLFE